MTKIQKYCYCIPEKVLKTVSGIENLPIPGFRKEYLLEILSLISENIRKDQDYARLKMSYLRILIPQASEYIRWLIGEGIIQRLGGYTPGYQSYSYKYAPEYKSPYKTFAVTDAKLIRRIDQQIHRRNSHKVNQLRYHSPQDKFIRRLVVDPEALEYIERNIIDPEKKNYAIGATVKIMNKDFYYSVNSTNGRYDSNITNLNKELRQFVTIDDEFLLNVDIKNSQPYMSTILLTRPDKVKKLSMSKNLYMMLDTLQGIEALDIKLYCSLVRYGLLYEYLITEFKKYGLILTRKKVKSEVFKILFSNNPKLRMSRTKRIFSILFPNVYERFCQVKGWQSGTNFENHNRFVLLLQKIESYVILEKILPRLYGEHPGIIAVTVHDSIMTSIWTNDAQKVKAIMNDELKSFFGIEPFFSVGQKN